MVLPDGTVFLCSGAAEGARAARTLGPGNPENPGIAGAGLHAAVTQESIARIEGTAVVLPDGTVLLCSGAASGARCAKAGNCGFGAGSHPLARHGDLPWRQLILPAAGGTERAAFGCCVVPQR